MDFTHINTLATVVAALSSFIVGGLWYSKVLFQTAWMADNNFTKEQMQAKGGGTAKIFAFTGLFSLISAGNLAMFLSPVTTTVAWGAEAGFLAGLWTFCAIATMSLFEQKSWRLIFINGGYSVVSLIIMGAIIGAWR